MIKKTLSLVFFILINLNFILAVTGIPKIELTLSPETKLAIWALIIALILIAIYWLLQQRVNREL